MFYKMLYNRCIISQNVAYRTAEDFLVNDYSWQRLGREVLPGRPPAVVLEFQPGKEFFIEFPSDFVAPERSLVDIRDRRDADAPDAVLKEINLIRFDLELRGRIVRGGFSVGEEQAGVSQRRPFQRERGAIKVLERHSWLFCKKNHLVGRDRDRQEQVFFVRENGVSGHAVSSPERGIGIVDSQQRSAGCRQGHGQRQKTDSFFHKSQVLRKSDKISRKKPAKLAGFSDSFLIVNGTR